MTSCACVLHESCTASRYFGDGKPAGAVVTFPIFTKNNGFSILPAREGR